MEARRALTATSWASSATGSRPDGAAPALWGEAGAEAGGSRGQERPGPASSGPAGPPPPVSSTSDDRTGRTADPEAVDTGTARAGTHDVREVGSGRPGPPVGDNSTLRRLRAELGSDAMADHFVTDFLALLDDRLVSLRTLIQRRRVEDSVTALLTIETSSLMIGAEDLAGAATRLRLAVSEHGNDPLDPLLEELAGAAEDTKRELAPPG